MPKQTQEQFAAFQALCRANNLDPKADVWQQKQSGQWIIGRTGIEKIQGLNNIGIDLELAAAAIDFAIVKCTATRTVKAEGAKTGKKLSITSFGSAQPKNSQVSYYAELAEKRAKSRAILMLMGFYELGIYGEDEADDFKRKADSISGAEATASAPAQPVGNVGGGSPMPSEPPVVPAVSSSAAPAPSTTSGLSIAGPVEIPAEIVAKYTRQFEAATTLPQVVKLWEGLTKNERLALVDAKEAAKVRLAEQPAPAAPLVSNIKEAGSDSALVDEFAEQPTMPTGTFGPATSDQKQAIQRHLNHPLITRKEKTAALLNINKMDTERARQLLVKLRAAIDERENSAPVTEADKIGEVRAAIGLLLKNDKQYLNPDEEANIRTAVVDSTLTLEQLTEVLEVARGWVLDGMSYGTEAGLAEVELDTLPS